MLSDGLIGALIGGGATVLVSAMTQIIVVRNLNKQHAHDAKQKAEDRKAAMRRDVYLQFVEDVLAVQEFLGELANKPSTFTDISAQQNFLKSSGKVWLIAERENALLSRELVGAMSAVSQVIIAKSIDVRLAVHVESDEGQQLTAAVQKLKEISDAKDGPPPTGSTADVHKRNMSALFEEIKSVVILQTAAAQKASEKANEERLKFARMVADDLKPVSALFVKVVTALRREIGLEGDANEFLLALQKSEEMSNQAMKQLFDYVGERRKSAVALFK